MAAALLIQMLLAMPSALRMTADASQWLQLDATICTAHENAAATDGDGPIDQAPSRHHGHCQLCLTHALPLGLLVVALCVLAVFLHRAAARWSVLTAPACRHDRYRSYYSRAPPVAA